ncbi:MAG: co-chaperone GroES [Chlamydiales bacterium]|nr:co-chaperone GroES [Chlamydiales bacterium]
MSANHIKPLGNRVLIKRLKSCSSKGGILLPESAQEKPKQGEVVAVGPGSMDEAGKRKPLNVSIGDLVLFSAYAGSEVKTEDSQAEYLIMSEEDVLGILV